MELVGEGVGWVGVGAGEGLVVFVVQLLRWWRWWVILGLLGVNDPQGVARLSLTPRLRGEAPVAADSVEPVGPVVEASWPARPPAGIVGGV